MRAIVRNAATSPHLSDLNSLLQRMEDITLSIYRENVGRVKLTHDLFRDRLNAEFFGQQVFEHTLVTFIREEMMKLKRAEGTIGNYKHTANALETFSKDRRASLDLDNINFDFLNSFKSWAFDRNYATGSVDKFIRITKTAVNLARKMNFTENRIVTERGFSQKKTTGTRKKLALYSHEVAAIAAFDWSTVERRQAKSIERLRRGADIIVAACGLGLRHSDFGKVTEKNVVKFRNIEMVQLWTQKSDKPVAIPLTPEVKAILQRYDYRLPSMSRGEMLRVGREVLEIVGIDREVSVKETKGNKLRIVHYKLYEKFSAHVTRRTFARNAYLADPSLLPAIQAILGHSTQAQTLDYIDIEDMLTAEHFAKRMEMQQPKLKAVK